MITEYKWPTSIKANDVWRNTVKQLLAYPSVVSPRGQPIKEMLGNQTVVDMHYPVLTNNGRKLGYRFMAAEAEWILLGDNRVDTIAPYSKAISSFSDDGKTFFGSYGVKISAQLPFVLQKLCEDHDTRQAVINIWRESPPHSKDIPCTLSLQFIYRAHQLNCVASMRSSDIWLGWPYDVFNFTMITAYVLLSLRKMHDYFQYGDIGRLFLTAGSQHLYLSNEAMAFDAMVSNDAHEERLDLNLFGSELELLEFLFYAKDRRLEEWRTKRKSQNKFLSRLL